MKSSIILLNSEASRKGLLYAVQVITQQTNGGPTQEYTIRKTYEQFHHFSVLLSAHVKNTSYLVLGNVYRNKGYEQELFELPVIAEYLVASLDEPGKIMLFHKIADFTQRCCHLPTELVCMDLFMNFYSQAKSDSPEPMLFSGVITQHYNNGFGSVGRNIAKHRVAVRRNSLQDTTNIVETPLTPPSSVNLTNPQSFRDSFESVLSENSDGTVAPTFEEFVTQLASQCRVPLKLQKEELDDKNKYVSMAETIQEYGFAEHLTLQLMSERNENQRISVASTIVPFDTLNATRFHSMDSMDHKNKTVMTVDTSRPSYSASTHSIVIATSHHVKVKESSFDTRMAEEHENGASSPDNTASPSDTVMDEEVSPLLPEVHLRIPIKSMLDTSGYATRKPQDLDDFSETDSTGQLFSAVTVVSNGDDGTEILLPSPHSRIPILDSELMICAKGNARQGDLFNVDYEYEKASKTVPHVPIRRASASKPLPAIKQTATVGAIRVPVRRDSSHRIDSKQHKKTNTKPILATN